MKFRAVELIDACCGLMKTAVEQAIVQAVFVPEEIRLLIVELQGKNRMTIYFCPFCGKRIEIDPKITSGPKSSEKE